MTSHPMGPVGAPRPDPRFVNGLELIRQIEGIETPAEGAWSVLANQALVLDQRWGLRSSARDLRTASGRLLLARTITATTLDLAAGIDAVGSPAFVFHGRLIEANRAGHWQVDGRAGLDGQDFDFTVELTYQGVFRHGAAPVALISIAGWGNPATARRWPRHRSKVDITGHLNLSPPRRFVTPARPTVAARHLERVPADVIDG